MIGHGEKLARKQEQAISALLIAQTVTAAAEMVGVSPVTLQRWMKTPAFHDAYLAARREVVAQASGQLAHACTDAVTTLRSVMADTTISPAARVNAARTVIDFAYKAIELEDLSERIADLERFLGEGRKGGSV